MIAIGKQKENRGHLQIARRSVVQYNFYINDERWGRMLVRVCLNQHRNRYEDLSRRPELSPVTNRIAQSRRWISLAGVHRRVLRRLDAALCPDGCFRARILLPPG